MTVFFGLVILYLLFRYYLPVSKLVTKLLGKKEPVIKTVEEESEVQLEEQPVEVEEFKPCIGKDLFGALLFALPFLLLFIVTNTWWHALVFFVVVFAINLICNIVISRMRGKCKLTYGIVLDLFLHLSAIYLFCTLSSFNGKLAEYGTFYAALGSIMFFGEPLCVLLRQIKEDLFGVKEKLFSLDSISGFLIRVFICYILASGNTLTIPFILAVYCGIRYHDFAVEEKRNSLLLDVAFNVALPVIYFVFIAL